MVCRTVITSITQRYQKLKTFPKFSFWSKLIETHKVMFNLNKGSLILIHMLLNHLIGHFYLEVLPFQQLQFEINR